MNVRLQRLFSSLGVKPCTFNGKMVTIGQMSVWKSSSRAQDEKPYESASLEPVARVNIHLDCCRVLFIVRVSNDGNLTESGLDDPEHEPWFLIHGEFRNIPRYFIINGNDEYLPVLHSPGGQLLPGDSKSRIISVNYSLMNPHVYKEEVRIDIAPHGGGSGEHSSLSNPNVKRGSGEHEFIYEWDMFSELDLYLVKEAIAAHTKGAY